MEVYVPSVTPASQELSSNSESVMTPSIQTHNSSGDLSMNDLKMCLNECISVEDIGISTSGLPAGNTSKRDVVMEDDRNDLDESSDSVTPQFPWDITDSLPESTSSVEGLLFEEKGREDYKTSEANGCNKSTDQCSPPKSSASPLKLASAMKGSREKQGILPMKLSVTWAPDVYDPIPTSVSHVPSSKNQYRNNGKKYGKNKQRGGGKASREGKGKGKGKKQAQKNGSNTTTKFKPVHEGGVVSFSEPESGIIDFNVVSTDPFCGSSFLKESVKIVHFPVAEATR